MVLVKIVVSVCVSPSSGPDPLNRPRPFPRDNSGELLPPDLSREVLSRSYVHLPSS